LPGLTRQSISFAISDCEEWTDPAVAFLAAAIGLC
jgi:hypothetical protein